MERISFSETARYNCSHHRVRGQPGAAFQGHVRVTGGEGRGRMKHGTGVWQTSRRKIKINALLTHKCFDT